MINYTRLLIVIISLYGQVFAQMPTTGHIFNSVVGNNSEPVIYNAVSLNTYELLTTNIQVSKVDNLQKVVFSPFKLLENPTLFRETKLNFAQKNGISTLGIGVGWDNSSPFSDRGSKKISTAFHNFPSLSPKNSIEEDYEYEIRKAHYFYLMDSTYASTYESLLKNSFKTTLGYNISLFEIIGGDQVDLDNDSIIDNYNKVESNNLSLGITYILSSKTAFNVTAHYSSKYASAREDEKLVEYVGGSFSVAQRIIILDKDYKKKADYLKTLFVPSVVAGASLEYQKAVGNSTHAKDGIIETIAFTPFLEFKINPQSQFRIGVPIKKYSGIKDEIAFGPFAQWTLQIAKIE